MAIKTLEELEFELKEIRKNKDKYLAEVSYKVNKEQLSVLYEKLAKVREAEKQLIKQIDELKKQ
jgi:hypothetical protein